MKTHKQRRLLRLLFLLVSVSLIVILPSLLFWRARREERLSAQLMEAVRNVLARSEIHHRDEDYTESLRIELEEVAQKDRKDEARVLRLLQAGANPNVRNLPVADRTPWEEAKFLRSSDSASSSPSALAMAVQADNAPIAAALLKAGADDVNAEIEGDDGRLTSLVYTSALNGHWEVVQALCADGADIHRRGKGAPSSDVEILSAALSNRYSSTNPGAYKTPISLMERNARTQMFHLFLTKGAKYDPHSQEGYSLLCDATASDLLDVTRELLAAGVLPNASAASPPQSPIQRALNEPADPNFTPLDHAVVNDDIPLVKLLLQHGARIRGEGMEAPILLVGSAEMAKLLLESGADLHAHDKDETYISDALIYASVRGDWRVIPFLLEHGFKVNSSGDLHNPIESAAQSADVQTVRLLLEHGAKVGPHSPGARALFLAIEAEHFDSAKLLLQYGADVNPSGEDTALAEAIMKRNADMVRELLKYGADVNADRGAALFAACGTYEKALIKMLLEHGATPNVRQSEGMTPIQYLREDEDPPGASDELVALLKQYGAKR